LDPRALAALQQYHWPGNVRELQNYVERAVVMATGDELTCELLPPAVTTGRSPRALGAPLDFTTMTEELVHMGLGEAGADAEDVHSRIVDRVEREVIAQVLQECAGVQIKAAGRLGINRNTLHKKLKQYGLDGSGGEEE
jgi:DNA-binding NtrC family response regulator